MTFVDSHCHLDFPDFRDGLDGVVATAREAGVTTMLTICTHVTRFAQVLALAERFENVFCTVGIHPHEAAREPEVSTETLIGLARHPKVVGFGETGLDYHYQLSPRVDQQRSFRTHITAARETGLPLIVHTRNADEDTVRILAREQGAGGFPGVLHCFSSSRALAEEAVEMGMYISFSGILTFKNATDLRETAAVLPLQKLLIETDAPYLAPVPKRGKRNEPAFVRYTAAELARIRNIEITTVAEVTRANFFRLFTKANP